MKKRVFPFLTGLYAGRSRYVRAVGEDLEVPSAAVYESVDREVDESYLSRYGGYRSYGGGRRYGYGRRHGTGRRYDAY